MNRPVAHPSSFRDPAGFVFRSEGKLYRQVNKRAKADYDQLMSSGLYEELTSKGLLVKHTEITAPKGLAADSARYKVIKPDIIPFISYPYEWTFAQLRDAALLTLKVQQIALAHSMILKDASAYNVQFAGSRPVLIDTLSFAKHKVGEPWEGYKQFCEHFVAPLALASYSTPEIIKNLRAYLDGVPLAVATSSLPKRARLRRGLLAHLYLHNNAQRRHQGDQTVAAATAKQRKLSPMALRGLLASLEHTVKKLRAPSVKTEWGNYYDFTNYSDKAFKEKQKTIQSLLEQIKPVPKTVWDIGANNGEFSEIAARLGAYTVAFDIDEVAVARNYTAKRDKKLRQNMLPLVQDLTNPSPALGWAHAERSSLVERGPADVVLALALIHHLAIGNNVPLGRIAEFLRQIGKHVIIEFVPKQDSKVQLLLSSRTDIFDEYDTGHFEQAMERYFTLVSKKPVKNSKRSIYLYKVR